MPIDPNIPLAVANPAELQQLAYRNQLAQLQVQQAQQAQQQNNALLGIMKQPGALDDQGMPTQATLGRVMQVNPEAGLKLQNQLAVMQENRQKAITNSINQRLLGMNIGAKQHDTLVDIATSAQQRYEDLVSQGTPKDEAARIAGQERNQSISDAQNSGMLTADQSRAFQLPFDPNINKAFISGSPQYKRVLDEQRAARQENTQERRLDLEEQRQDQQMNAPVSDIGKLSYDYQRGKISKSDYDAAIQNKTKNFNPEDVSQMVDLVGQYKVPPPSGYALRSPWGQAVMSALAERYPQYNGQEFKSRQQALAKFTSGKQGDTVRSLSVSLDHLGVLSQAADALKNGNVQAFNKLAQGLAEQTGSAVPTNFESVKSIVADEVTKAVLGGPGGVGDREKAQAIFDKVKSPEQLAGAIDQVKALMKGQLRGMKRQYEQATGMKDFDRFLSPAAQGLDEGGPKKISSKADYDALPSGTVFIAPDGSQRRKP